VTTRFAPSPTGHLHLGHLLNAIHVWRLARRAGGLVRLRIEDHDRERARPEFEQSILDDLEWLGFTPDVPPIAAFRAGPCEGRQSDHLTRYEDALARLDRDGRVYGCACSRAQILLRTGGSTPSASRAALASARGGRPAAAEDTAELRYDGFCRSRGLRPGPDVGTRVRLDPGVETFDDGRLGPQQQDPMAQCGDLLVRDRRGNWTYQFAVTVDDLVEDITDVIRGRDLLTSTGRQIQLARLLGRSEPPAFLHHPLILGADGEKLSKSRGDTALRELRAAGLSPAEAIARAEAAAVSM
jgi:glutamyl/glutaminyl-tRNA synthetase